MESSYIKKSEQDKSYPESTKQDQTSLFTDRSKEASQMNSLKKGIENSSTTQNELEWQKKVALAEEKANIERVNNTGVPDPLLQKMEHLSGIDLSAVRVYYNSQKPAQIGALAYAEGTNIFIGPEQEEHLEHELWHVVQQLLGRAKVTDEVGGKKVDKRKSMEQEATDQANKSVNLDNIDDSQKKKVSNPQSIVQMVQDLFSKDAFADPVGYLSTNNPNDRVVENGGSKGIDSDPMADLITALGSKDHRKVITKKIDKLFNTATSTKDSQKALKKLNSLNFLFENLSSIKDNRSAAIFVRQNTLAFSNVPKKILDYLKIPTEHVHIQGNGDNPNIQTFHFDSTYLTVDPAKLHGSQQQKTQKANALNGPFQGRGWVPGHVGIANMKHRFIEHIHVNKDGAEDDRIDIYNSNNENDGATAEAWTDTINAAPDLHGLDLEALKDLHQVKVTSDLDRLYPLQWDNEKEP